MDNDIPMADDSSADSLPSQQRFNIVDVLGGGGGGDDATGTLSDMFEADEAAVSERLAKLYPHARKQPLPRYWSNTDKYHTISMSSDSLRVRYKGKGGGHKDAAAVRANHPIPKSTVVYYFEIVVTSKGVNGFVGIGLSEKSVNLNRLPGWDAVSFGYHGDDGNFFSSSGKGTEYGPVYTTGDVVGCGINFISRQIFFTKNGLNLGVAATNVPISNPLYPTIGMQTIGEMIDTNFGQRPFVYDLTKDLMAAEAVTITSVSAIELPSEKALWLNRTVTQWLAHEGYSRALEAFNRATGITQPSTTTSSSTSTESLAARKSSNGSESTIAATATATATAAAGGSGSGERQSVVKLLRKAIQEEMDNRRAIIRLVHDGRSAEAIAKVSQYYPRLLDSNKQLALLLKIQQFIEQLVAITKDISLSAESINGASSWEAPSQGNRGGGASPLAGPSSSSQSGGGGRPKRSTTSTNNAQLSSDNGTRNAVKRRSSEANQEEVEQVIRQSPRTRRAAAASTSRAGGAAPTNGAASGSGSGSGGDEPMEMEDPGHAHPLHHPTNGNSQSTNGRTPTTAATTSTSAPIVGTPPTSTTIIEEEEMGYDDLFLEEDTKPGAEVVDGVLAMGAGARNGHQQHLSKSDEMLEKGFEKYLPLIEFGQSLAHFANTQLYETPSPMLRKRMNDAFSLICSPCPYMSDNSYLLGARQRHIIAKALNSAILETLGKEGSASVDKHIRKARQLREKALKVSASAIFTDADRLLFGEKTITSV